MNEFITFFSNIITFEFKNDFNYLINGKSHLFNQITKEKSLLYRILNNNDKNNSNKSSIKPISKRVSFSTKKSIELKKRKSVKEKNIINEDDNLNNNLFICYKMTFKNFLLLFLFIKLLLFILNEAKCFITMKLNISMKEIENTSYDDYSITKFDWNHYIYYFICIFSLYSTIRIDSEKFNTLWKDKEKSNDNINVQKSIFYLIHFLLYICDYRYLIMLVAIFIFMVYLKDPYLKISIILSVYYTFGSIFLIFILFVIIFILSYDYINIIEKRNSILIENNSLLLKKYYVLMKIISSLSNEKISLFKSENIFFKTKLKKWDSNPDELLRNVEIIEENILKNMESFEIFERHYSIDNDLNSEIFNRINFKKDLNVNKTNQNITKNFNSFSLSSSLENVSTTCNFNSIEKKHDYLIFSKHIGFYRNNLNSDKIISVYMGSIIPISYIYNMFPEFSEIIDQFNDDNILDKLSIIFKNRSNLKYFNERFFAEQNLNQNKVITKNQVNVLKVRRSAKNLNKIKMRVTKYFNDCKKIIKIKKNISHKILNKIQINNSNNIFDNITTNYYSFYSYIDISEYNNIFNMLSENKFKNILMSKISHEIKTPLITSNMIVEKITSDLNKIKSSFDFNIISKLNKNLKKILLINEIIINVVFEMNSLVAGFKNTEINTVKININDLAKWSYHFIKLSLEANPSKKINPVYISNPNISKKNIFSDNRILKMILIHLLRNSVKFTKQGSIEISMDYEMSETSKNAKSDNSLLKPPELNYNNKNKDEENIKYICLSIKDSGDGMSEEKLIEVKNFHENSTSFQKNIDYVMLSGRKKSKSLISKNLIEDNFTYKPGFKSEILNLNLDQFLVKGGLRLGLRTVYEFSKLLNIKFEIKSTLNKGTTFILKFPYNNELNENESISNHRSFNRKNITQLSFRTVDVLNNELNQNSYANKDEKNVSFRRINSYNENSELLYYQSFNDGTSIRTINTLNSNNIINNNDQIVDLKNDQFHGKKESELKFESSFGNNDDLFNNRSESNKSKKNGSESSKVIVKNQNLNLNSNNVILDSLNLEKSITIKNGVLIPTLEKDNNHDMNKIRDNSFEQSACFKEEHNEYSGLVSNHNSIIQKHKDANANISDSEFENALMNSGKKFSFDNQKFLSMQPLKSSVKLNSPLIHQFQSKKNIEDTVTFSNEEILNMDNIDAIILIVDDDYFCRNTLKSLVQKILSKLSLNKVIVKKGSDGIDTINLVIQDQIKYNKIKLVISDENMNYCNGSDSYYLLNKMYKNDKLKKIPLWILTALEDDNELKNIKNKSGCDLILKKPASYTLLYENISKVFQIKNSNNDEP